MDPVRFAVVGYGAWGSHHARAIAATPDAQLTAVAERNPESRARAQADHPGIRVYDDYRELLAREPVNVVDLVIPSHIHYEVARDVLAAGRHLLLEKPMALSLAHCQELAATAHAKKLCLAVGHEFRLSSLWARVKQLIDEGAIGDPLYAMIELWRNPYRLGSDGWRYDLGRVGNWILEEPIHFFDLARWYLAGSGEPLSVFAQANAKRPDRPELHDNFTAMLSFPGGRYAVVAQTLGGWEHHQSAKLVGTNGAIWASWSGALDRTFQPTFWLKVMRGDRLEEIRIDKLTGEVYELADEMQMLVRCVRTGEAPFATGDDGLWSVRMCLAAQHSVDEKRPVLMSEVG